MAVLKVVNKLPSRAQEYTLRKTCGNTIGGIDEVGRGAWAGPLVMAVVIAGDSVAPTGIMDSKLVKKRDRKELANSIENWAKDTGVGWVSAEEIDNLGMSHCLRLCANRTIKACTTLPDGLLGDGSVDFLKDGEFSAIPARWAPKSDQTQVVTAAASLLAKVKRDEWMEKIAEQWPEYGFASNVGYPSAFHRTQLLKIGPCHIHRVSWKWVKDLGPELLEQDWIKRRLPNESQIPLW